MKNEISNTCEKFEIGGTCKCKINTHPKKKLIISIAKIKMKSTYVISQVITYITHLGRILRKYIDKCNI